MTKFFFNSNDYAVVKADIENNRSIMNSVITSLEIQYAVRHEIFIGKLLQEMREKVVFYNAQLNSIFIDETVEKGKQKIVSEKTTYITEWSI
jgi:hypothetical protein